MEDMSEAAEMGEHLAVAQALREQLWPHLDTDAPRWVLALLDPNHPVAVHDPLHVTRLAQRQPPVEWLPVRREDFLSSPELWPQLLVLRAPDRSGWIDEPLLDLTVAHALERRTSINGAYVCGWLVTDRDPADIARQMKRALQQRMSFLQQRALAWFEPHRWALLMASEDARAWLRTAMAGVHSWSWIDLAGHLNETLFTGHNEAPVAGALTGADWARQQRVPQARQVVLALTKADIDLPADAERHIDQALLQADVLGLILLEDRLCFALHSVGIGPQWHRHPAATACIECATNGESTLADALDALDDETLHRIAITAGEHVGTKTSKEFMA